MLMVMVDRETEELETTPTGEEVGLYTGAVVLE